MLDELKRELEKGRVTDALRVNRARREGEGGGGYMITNTRRHGA